MNRLEIREIISNFGTPRIRVIYWKCQDWSNSQVADYLGLNLNSVQHHLTETYKLFGLDELDDDEKYPELEKLIKGEILDIIKRVQDLDKWKRIKPRIKNEIVAEKKKLEPQTEETVVTDEKPADQPKKDGRLRTALEIALGTFSKPEEVEIELIKKDMKIKELEGEIDKDRKNKRLRERDEKRKKDAILDSLSDTKLPEAFDITFHGELPLSDIPLFWLSLFYNVYIFRLSLGDPLTRDEVIQALSYSHKSAMDLIEQEGSDYGLDPAKFYMLKNMSDPSYWEDDLWDLIIDAYIDDESDEIVDEPESTPEDTPEKTPDETSYEPPDELPDEPPKEIPEVPPKVEEVIDAGQEEESDDEDSDSPFVYIPPDPDPIIIEPADPDPEPEPEDDPPPPPPPPPGDNNCLPILILPFWLIWRGIQFLFQNPRVLIGFIVIGTCCYVSNITGLSARFPTDTIRSALLSPFTSSDSTSDEIPTGKIAEIDGIGEYNIVTGLRLSIRDEIWYDGENFIFHVRIRNLDEDYKRHTVFLDPRHFVLWDDKGNYYRSQYDKDKISITPVELSYGRALVYSFWSDSDFQFEGKLDPNATQLYFNESYRIRDPQATFTFDIIK